MPEQRTIFANTVEAALALARREHGEDTLLLGSRPADGSDARLGAYRVDFQIQDSLAPAPTVEDATPRFRPSSPPAVLSLDAIQAELGRLTAMVSQLSSGLCQSGASPELTAIAADLVAKDFPPDLVLDLLDRIDRRLRLRARLEPASAGLIRQALIAEAEARIKVDAGFDPAAPARRMIALVGPAGAGKTTTLAKLAMIEGVGARRPTAIISTDSHRVAAAEQLRAYAAILGLPFAMVDSVAALSQTLEEHRQKQLVLIDTPGFSPLETECRQHWAEMLKLQPQVETHLVLSATTRTMDLMAAVRWWDAFQPSKLIFTRLDETACTGGCLTAAMLSRKPVSYLGTGQRIPEDIERASLAGMIRLLLGNSQAVGATA
jgi:flagellar biosynthesis protein FlhF